MRNVTVEKDELRTILEKNQVTHVADFELAWAAYHKAVMSNAEKLLEAAKNMTKASVVNLYINLARPENHVEDYVRAIEMCDWEIKDEVELTEGEFRELVQDNWSWKGNFEASNMMYTGSASPSSR